MFLIARIARHAVARVQRVHHRSESLPSWLVLIGSARHQSTTARPTFATLMSSDMCGSQFDDARVPDREDEVPEHCPPASPCDRPRSSAARRGCRPTAPAARAARVARSQPGAPSRTRVGATPAAITAHAANRVQMVGRARRKCRASAVVRTRMAPPNPLDMAASAASARCAHSASGFRSAATCSRRHSRERSAAGRC